MKRWTWIAALLFLAACEQDDAIIDQQRESLHTLITKYEEGYVSDRFHLQIGNHPSFEKTTDQHPYHIIFRVPENAFDLRYFETDSFRRPDSLPGYIERNPQMIESDNGFFKRYARRDVPNDRYVRVTYRLGDSLFMSQPASLRTSENLETYTLNGIEVRPGPDSTLFFSWPDSVAFDEFLFVLKGNDGDIISANYSDRASFLFYDLRTVLRNLTPDLVRPKLIRNEEYDVDVYGINSRDWIMAQGSLEFVAP